MRNRRLGHGRRFWKSVQTDRPRCKPMRNYCVVADRASGEPIGYFFSPAVNLRKSEISNFFAILTDYLPDSNLHRRSVPSGDHLLPWFWHGAFRRGKSRPSNSNRQRTNKQTNERTSLPSLQSSSFPGLQPPRASEPQTPMPPP